MSPRIPIITGTTASGKTALSLAYAQRDSRIEIINADSLLVYRGMDIGTAKPTAAERAQTPHHLIDICEPNEEYTAAQFTRDCERLIADIQGRGHRPLIVGGTGFYIKALLFGLWDAPPTNAIFRDSHARTPTSDLHQALVAVDPKAAENIGAADRYRLLRSLEIYTATGQLPSELEAAAKARAPDPRFALLITELPSHELDEQISQRVQTMLDAGLVEETRLLHSRYPLSRALRSVGYHQTLVNLEIEAAPTGRKIAPGIAGLKQEIVLATRQLAKSQRTWYRGQFEPRFTAERYVTGHPLHDRVSLLETLARWQTHP